MNSAHFLHYQKNSLWSWFCDCRARDNRSYASPAIVMLGEDFPQQQQQNTNTAGAANLFRLYNSGNFGQVFNGTVFSDPESELTCNLSGSRKRPREEEHLLLAQAQQFQLMSMPDFQQKNTTVSLASASASGPVAQQPSALVSTGLQLAYDDSRLNQPATSTSGRAAKVPVLFSLLADDISAHLQHENEDIQRFMRLQTEKVRVALEEKSRRHSRVLVATIEEGMMRTLKEKETELENASRRNAELEERVKQLTMDKQIWQNMAKSNEAKVTTLKSNLEQVVAQCREQIREGYGDSEADDAESCCHDDTGDVHARTLKENKELKDQRTCRACRRNDICILLLPCRHLCLCKECESRLHTCPLCNSMKNGGVQIYMS